MTYGLNRKVDVQVWPVDVLCRWLFDVDHFADRSVAKPWELFEGKKKLFSAEE